LLHRIIGIFRPDFVFDYALVDAEADILLFRQGELIYAGKKNYYLAF
jgi:hypothetical protein